MENLTEDFTTFQIVVFFIITLVLFIFVWIFFNWISKKKKENEIKEIEIISEIKGDLILIGLEDKIFPLIDSNGPPMIFTFLKFKYGDNKTTTLVLDEDSCEETKKLFSKARQTEPGKIIDW